MTTRPQQPSVEDLMEHMRQQQAQLTTERADLATLRAEREVPRELAQADSEPVRSAGAVGIVAMIAAVVLGVFACAAVNVADRWLATHDPAQGALAAGLVLVAVLALGSLTRRR